MFSEDKPVLKSKHFAEYQEMFSNAGKLAILDAKKRGLPITYVENNKIVTEYADGHIEICGDSPPWVYVGKKTIKLK
ncbi:hypothetical protein FACS189494_07780 [Spirochaetia bacterium]|nr:hypothetical protein FACS189494_07780 [Spirochaetia bacterium]